MSSSWSTTGSVSGDGISIGGVKIPVREQVLDQAKSLISGDRAQTYGSAQRNFSQVAQLWKAQFGWDVSAADVAQAMILLKLARVGGNPAHQDSWTDIAGYAGLGAEVGGNSVSP